MLDLIFRNAFNKAFNYLYGTYPNPQHIIFQKTRPEIEGDFTIAVFPFSKIAGKQPEAIANEIGNEMLTLVPVLSGFQVIKGFLNLKVADEYWLGYFADEATRPEFGFGTSQTKEKIVIEYSSPNTNKPLHLGHIRNNLLGWSVAEILKACGHKVVKVNLVNDRGIHICKSMLAWQRWGGGKTPETTGIKGDKLVGEMYVRFDQENKRQADDLVALGMEKPEAANKTTLMAEAREMLLKWEADDEETRKRWQTMNKWVYDGFDITYNRLGIDFDKIYYESDTYLLGKELVLKGLEQHVFYRKDDGSVWCHLGDENLDEKLLLRADGTSVYMTQDLGTANQRASDYHPDKMIYVVGNEQNYHFDVLKLILRKLQMPWADAIEHLSYGMVELPEGKMKSREGKVVDADDLMDEVIATARQMTMELGKLDGLDESEAEQLFQTIGLGALKYFMLKVDPKKTMLFNPVESVDFNGNTGPFIQYTHARIKSVIRKAIAAKVAVAGKINEKMQLMPKERTLVVLIYELPEIISQAGESRSPALVANYMYELAKEFNQFYQECPILREADEQRRLFRLQLCQVTADVLKKAGGLLGIEMPERM
jgi:arginyl-tRNA synthetase